MILVVESPILVVPPTCPDWMTVAGEIGYPLSRDIP